MWYSDYVIGLTTEESKFNFLQGKGIFLLPTIMRLDLGLNQSLTQLVLGAPSPAVKWPQGTHHGHSPPLPTEVRNPWSQTFTYPNIFMAWCLIKHRDKCTVTLYTMRERGGGGKSGTKKNTSH